jgi:hypothetical protein
MLHCSWACRAMPPAGAWMVGNGGEPLVGTGSAWSCVRVAADGSELPSSI